MSAVTAGLSLCMPCCCKQHGETLSRLCRGVLVSRCCSDSLIGKALAAVLPPRQLISPQAEYCTLHNNIVPLTCRNRDDNIAIYAPTPELQKQRGCWAAAAGVAWGAPHMLWWAFYDNEQTRSGAYRGYWLVDNANRETPLFNAYQQYYRDAQEFVRSVMGATGKPPSDYAFRKWAVQRLVQLSGKTDVALPEVRYWGF